VIWWKGIVSAVVAIVPGVAIVLWLGADAIWIAVPLPFLILGTIAVVGGYFADAAVTQRALRKAPVVSIAGFPTGTVGRINGRVEPTGEWLISPLTKRPCVHYHLVVEERHRVGPNNIESWTDVIDEEDIRDFYVVDEGGKALVVTDSADVAVTKDGYNTSGMSGRDAPSWLEELLRERGLRSSGFGPLRYTEGVIEPGESVTVMGRARRALQREEGLFDIVVHRGRHLNVLVSDDTDTVQQTFTAQRRKRRARGLCTECGYDLRGDYGGGCPECGWKRSATPAQGA
jgi:hypothetical protein